MKSISKCKNVDRVKEEGLCEEKKNNKKGG